MTINLKLLTGEPLKPAGYPLNFIISHKGKKRKYQVGYSHPEHFLETEAIISVYHPDYEILYPDIMNFKFKAKEILQSRPDDINEVYDQLFSGTSSTLTLKGFTDDLVADMKKSAESYEKIKDFVSANKIKGNVKVYSDAITQLQLYAPNIAISDLDYTTLVGFKEWKLLPQGKKKGNSKSTVSVYLRSLRTLYNKAVKIHKLKDTKPFELVFSGLTVKSHQTRKKNVSKEMIRKIEEIVHDYDSLYRFTDMWLLQFYLGGADLIDIYYLKKNQIKKNRIYFQRTKGNSTGMMDLAIHPKAKAIIEKYSEPDGEYIFPWRKDNDGYKGFRRKMQAALSKAQEKHGIELEGTGGNLGLKVARHTFANIGKNQGLEEDLLRELMGHERDDVDNYYKDRFPEKVRDAALFAIID